MNNHRLLTGLLIVILLSGGVCAAGQFRRVVTMEELFEIAETNSAQLRPSMTAEEEARSGISVARSGLLPDISARMTMSYIGNGFTTKRDMTDFQRAAIPHWGSGLGVNVIQPVYTGGAVSKTIEMAELKSTAARYTTELKRNSIRFQLAGFYLDIYKYGNLRSVVTNHIEQARKVLAEMKVRYGQGTALKNDITRYELLVSSLELQLVGIDNALGILNHNLVVTAGLPADTEIEPDSSILNRSLVAAGESWWQQEAVNNAPELKLAASGVEMSRKAESLVKGARLPKVSLQAGWAIDGPILVEVPPINRNLSYWYAGVSVSYDVSSLYKNRRAVSRSKAATRKSLEQLDAAREHVALGVRADYVHYLEACEELKTRRKALELAGSNYRIVAIRYSAGMALITDMLDAANSKLDAEQQLVNARINIIYYYYKLLFISGKI